MSTTEPSKCVTPAALPFNKPFKAIYSRTDNLVTVVYADGTSHIAQVKAGQLRIIAAQRITAATTFADLEVSLDYS